MPEHIRKAFPHAFIGFDKTGQPGKNILVFVPKFNFKSSRVSIHVLVWLVNYGLYDFKTILADESNMEAVEMYRHQSVYRMWKSMKMRRIPGEISWACITNMDGYSFSQAFDLTSK